MLYTIFTGDFAGYAATGLEEDSPAVLFALALHSWLFS